MSLKSKEDQEKGIRATLILEMIGRPKEFISESMGRVIEEMEKEKGVQVVSKKVNEPIELKESKEFFTTFAEIEIEVEEIANLAILMFKYMPAHVEIIEPELIALTNNGWSDILSELTRRLHGYDEVARVLQYENAELKKKIEELSSAKTETEIKKEVKEKPVKKNLKKKD